MIDTFQILIQPLEGGKSEKISFSTTPEFLGVDEKDLSFSDPVEITGKAYLTDDHLVLHLSAQTYATVCCSICNDPYKALLKIENVYHTEPIQDIRGSSFDFHGPLREALLIELPTVTECHDGSCPERGSINNFLKQDKTQSSDDVYYPFSDLN